MHMHGYDTLLVVNEEGVVVNHSWASSYAIQNMQTLTHIS